MVLLSSLNGAGGDFGPPAMERNGEPPVKSSQSCNLVIALCGHNRFANPKGLLAAFDSV